MVVDKRSEMKANPSRMPCFLFATMNEALKEFQTLIEGLEWGILIFMKTLEAGPALAFSSDR